MSQNKTITYRYITPVFYSTALNKPFQYSGSIDQIQFNITFKYISKKDKELEELLQLEYFRKNVINRDIIDILENVRKPLKVGPLAEHFVIIDITYPFKARLITTGSTEETVKINSSILMALKLHCSKGLLFDKSYAFKLEPYGHKCGLSNSSPLIPQYIFNHLGIEDSLLPEDAHDSCRQIFDKLLLRGEPKNTYDKILDLALNYHHTSFCLNSVEYSYLILMIIFESLFKAEGDNSQLAAKRISRWLSNVQKDQKAVQKEFLNSFDRIRNLIAHGDPNLDKKVVKDEYKKLYQYITRVIIKLILLPDNAIDHSKDYYQEIDQYIENYFVNLPRT